ncbi:MAG: 50S ribosomal protein L9 [Alphaproteobacteria bacterium]|nr:50S ribosomal protein L9 [Alphaproteobacteria bacterium]
MDVILLERVEKLGQMGDVVSVKNGFARNCLLPRRKALRATKENIAGFENRRAQYEAQNLERRKEADAISAKLDGLDLVVIRQASENGQLYGSVAARDVSEGVTEAGFTIDRRQVEMPGPIKTLGVHDIRIMLHPEVAVGVRINVARSQEEAEARAVGGAVDPADPAEAPESGAEGGPDGLQESGEATAAEDAAGSA